MFKTLKPTFNFHLNIAYTTLRLNLNVGLRWQPPHLFKLHLKCPWHEIFYYLVRKSFQNDEEWRLFYFDSTLGCRVIKDFDLCKLDECDVTKGTQSGAKSQKIEYLCNY